MYLPHVETPRVPDPPPDAVRALSDRVAVKCQFIFLFDEDVERAVVGVPRVTELRLVSGARHVQQEIQPGRFGEIGIPQDRVLPAVSQGPVGRGAPAFPAAVHRLNAAGDLLSHGCGGKGLTGGGGRKGGGRVVFEQVGAALRTA